MDGATMQAIAIPLDLLIWFGGGLVTAVVSGGTYFAKAFLSRVRHLETQIEEVGRMVPQIYATKQETQKMIGDATSNLQAQIDGLRGDVKSGFLDTRTDIRALTEAVQQALVLAAKGGHR